MGQSEITGMACIESVDKRRFDFTRKIVEHGFHGLTEFRTVHPSSTITGEP